MYDWVYIAAYDITVITHNAYLLVQDGFQPIHSACFKGHVNVLRLLVEVYGVEPITVLKVCFQLYENVIDR